MLIRVIYNDKRYDMVKDYVLQELIDRGEIWGFKRSSGWVVVGEDQVRREQRPFYGSEKRNIARKQATFQQWRKAGAFLKKLEQGTR